MIVVSDRGRVGVQGGERERVPGRDVRRTLDFEDWMVSGVASV